MKDTMGVIYTSQNDLSLRELTVSRSVAALPVAGRYRLIDFTLSNLVNSGIRNVGIIMQRNYHSLMDHIGSGMEWDLHTRTDGLHILPPFLTRENVGTYEGILDALYSNMGYLTRSTQTYVILTSSKTALNVTFDDMLRFHEDSGNDITLMYSPKAHDEVDNTPTLTPRHVYMDVDDYGHVRDIEIGPSAPSSNNFYIDVMLLKRSLLLQMIDQAHAHGMHDLNRDFLQRYIRSGLFRVGGYCFRGYNRRIATINSYYRFNMDLLRPEVRRRDARPLPLRLLRQEFSPGRRLRDRGHGGKQHSLPRRARGPRRGGARCHPHAGRGDRRGSPGGKRDPGQRRHRQVRIPPHHPVVLSHRHRQGPNHLTES